MFFDNSTTTDIRNYFSGAGKKHTKLQDKRASKSPDRKSNESFDIMTEQFSLPRINGKGLEDKKGSIHSEKRAKSLMSK